MQVGLLGLGRMGSRMSRRLLAAGHEVVSHDPAVPESDVASIEQLAERLAPPRVVWVMVPAGAPTDAAFAALAPLVAPGDLLVDGGNSHFRDSMRRAEALAERGVQFLDAGVSGGIHGEEHGFCAMVGGPEDAVRRIEPLLAAIAAPSGYAHLGPSGAGHYAKMCHNAIEYALIEAYAEGLDLLSRFDAPLDIHRVAELWTHGSVVRSWLLTLVAGALEKNPALEGIAPYVQDSGEGRWAVQEAVSRGVSTGVIAQALFRRFDSRDPDAYAMRLVAALRDEFGAHGTRPA